MVSYIYIPPSATPQFFIKIPGANLSTSILNYILATSYLYHFNVVILMGLLCYYVLAPVTTWHNYVKMLTTGFFTLSLINFK